VAGGGCLDDADRERGAAALAKPHSQIQHRPKAETPQHLAMVALRGHVTRHAMIDRR
jgi:hypothetical protein